MEGAKSPTLPMPTLSVHFFIRLFRCIYDTWALWPATSAEMWNGKNLGTELQRPNCKIVYYVCIAKQATQLTKIGISHWIITRCMTTVYHTCSFYTPKFWDSYPFRVIRLRWDLVTTLTCFIRTRITQNSNLKTVSYRRVKLIQFEQKYNVIGTLRTYQDQIAKGRYISPILKKKKII